MSLLNWPAEFERTSEHERERTSKFSVGFRSTKSDLKKGMERMEVDEWRLEDVSGSGGDPGVVLRWQDDGQEYAVACDHYTAKGDNLRSIYLWVHETRMRAQRPVVTGEDEFAAARLPPGEEAADVVVAGDGREEAPHEVLGVAPDADPEVIRAAARQLQKKHHPDRGGSATELQRVTDAKEALLDG